MAWTKYPGRARDIHGSVLASVKVFVDYNDATKDRSSCLLEIKKYTQGSGDDLSVTGNNDSFTLKEGPTEDFELGTSNAETAEIIATEIGNQTNFQAQATATGAEGNPYVSVYYSNGYIANTTTSDSGAWDWKTINDSNAIATIAVDDSGTIKHQPIFTNSDGIVSCYVEGPDGGKIDVDLVPEKSGYTRDATYTEDISLPT